MAKRAKRGRGRRRPMRRRMRKEFNGGLVRGRMQPRVTTASPWNNYTLTTVLDFSSSAKTGGLQCLNVETLRSAIKTELGLSKTSANATVLIDIDMRVLRIDLWVPPALTNGDKNYIVFSPSDWSTFGKCTDWSQLEWFEVWGTAVRPAHLHYVWPRSRAIQVISFDDTDVTIGRFDLKDNDCKYIAKVHTQWRASNPDPRPVTACRLLSLREYRSSSTTTTGDLATPELSSISLQDEDFECM